MKVFVVLLIAALTANALATPRGLGTRSDTRTDTSTNNEEDTDDNANSGSSSSSSESGSDSSSSESMYSERIREIQEQLKIMTQIIRTLNPRNSDVKAIQKGINEARKACNDHVGDNKEAQLKQAKKIEKSLNEIQKYGLRIQPNGVPRQGRAIVRAVTVCQKAVSAIYDSISQSSEYSEPPESVYSQRVREIQQQLNIMTQTVSTLNQRSSDVKAIQNGIDEARKACNDDVGDNKEAQLKQAKIIEKSLNEIQKYGLKIQPIGAPEEGQAIIRAAIASKEAVSVITAL